eukprot:COSAG02_NODE_40336_length_406_cov_2.550489_1_plen_42_part_10
MQWEPKRQAGPRFILNSCVADLVLEGWNCPSKPASVPLSEYA